MNKAEEIAVAEALNQLRAHQDSRDNSGTHPIQVPISGTLPVNQKHGTQLITEKVVENKGDTRTLRQREQEHNGGTPPSPPIPDADEEPAPATNTATVPGENGTHNQPQWRNMLLTATSLVLTKDARNKLRHLLRVLRLASDHLNVKVNALKEAMDNDADNDHMKPKISKVAIRNDIITTIKKCLTMLSTLATNTLPAAARGRVRNTLLRLPSRWASQLGNGKITETDGKSESAALALATETLISIQNITNILSESMDRADSWVERLPNFRMGKRRRNDELDRDDADGSQTDGSQPTTRTGTPIEEPEPKVLKTEEEDSQ